MSAAFYPRDLHSDMDVRQALPYQYRLMFNDWSLGGVAAEDDDGSSLSNDDFIENLEHSEDNEKMDHCLRVLFREDCCDYENKEDNYSVSTRAEEKSITSSPLQLIPDNLEAGISRQAKESLKMFYCRLKARTAKNIEMKIESKKLALSPCSLSYEPEDEQLGKKSKKRLSSLSLEFYDEHLIEDLPKLTSSNSVTIQTSNYVTLVLQKTQVTLAKRSTWQSN